MNHHWEAQTVLESLTWLSQNLTGLDTETAELILVAEQPWAIVLDAAKARLLGPQGAPAPAKPAITAQIATGGRNIPFPPRIGVSPMPK